MVTAADLPVLVIAALAMLACLSFPWLVFPRRFSLRALLIATTLFAVVLGVTCYMIR